MMGPAHRSMAAPFGLGLTVVTDAAFSSWFPTAPSWGPTVFAISAGLLVVGSAKLPDLDHPRFQGIFHPGAAAVRISARLLLLLFFTDKDQHRNDLHRGPTHTVEWAFGLGALITTLVLLSEVTFRAPFVGALAVAALWGFAVMLGCLTHLLGDWLTLSGIP